MPKAIGVAFKLNYAQNQEPFATHPVFSHEKTVATQFHPNHWFYNPIYDKWSAFFPIEF